MSHTPHELAEEFPQDHEVLHRLKVENAHYAQVADEYHEINRHIHRIEAMVEAASDEVLTELKKQRLALKDEVAQMIAAARSAAA